MPSGTYDPDICRYMESLDHNDFEYAFSDQRQIIREIDIIISLIFHIEAGPGTCNESNSCEHNSNAMKVIFSPLKWSKTK